MTDQTPVETVAEALYDPLIDADADARARDALASLAWHRDDIARVLTEHRPHPVSSPHCACGWRPAVYLNDTESDRRQHRAHQADAVLTYLTGGAR